ncbi:MAG: type VI secretion system-associated protein TagF [Burkholderiaceae bacterium]|nr:type VI secretion system-associated protein TagF [Burkholderiaceae bacterium]
MHGIGWFGKLPSTGDFVGRRLPAEFQNSWDQWLQDGLTHSRRNRGDNWLDLYLVFPVWRFVLPAGRLGQSGWCGVLMPSVDRVGRYFPLTICERIATDAVELGLRKIDEQLDLFTQAGLDALDGMSGDELDERLEGIAPIQAGNPSPGFSLEAFTNGSGSGRWALNEPLDQALARAAERTMLANLSDRALWWLPATRDGQGEIRLSRIPLGAALFDELISAAPAR